MQADRDKSKEVYNKVREQVVSTDTGKTALTILVGLFLKLWWLWIMIAAVLILKRLARK